MSTVPSHKLREDSRSHCTALTMSRPLQKPKSSARRHRVTTKAVAPTQFSPIFNAYAQCMCDLANSLWNPYVQSTDDLSEMEILRRGSSLPPERFVPLSHDDGTTSSHLPECPQLHTEESKTSKKASSHKTQTSYLDVEEEEKSKAYTRKENARRQRKEARKSRDAEAKAEAKKAGKLATNCHAQCHCYDALGSSEEDAVREEARTVCHTHTDGTASFHLPNCPTSKTYPRKKTNSTRRDPPKSAAYIFSEGDEEGEEAGQASPAAKLYDSSTIASDILRAIGKHPYLPPLNAHMEGYSTKMKGRAGK